MNDSDKKDDIDNSKKSQKVQQNDSTSDAISKLQAKRSQLKRNVKDPLQEILVKASSAITAPCNGTSTSSINVNANTNTSTNANSNTASTNDLSSIITEKVHEKKDDGDDSDTTCDFYSVNSSMHIDNANKKKVSINNGRTEGNQNSFESQNAANSNSNNHQHIRNKEGKKQSGVRVNTSALVKQQPPSSPNKREIHTPSLYQRKKSARQEKFDDDGFGDSDDFNNEIVDLGGPKRRRGKYSEEEMDAIADGVKAFGTKWSKIKSTYPILNGRGNVSLKVRKYEHI